MRTITFSSSDAKQPDDEPALEEDEEEDEEEELLEEPYPVQFMIITIWRPAASYSKQVEIPAGLVWIATWPALL